MTIEELKARRIELGYSYQELAGLSGVPVGTLQKVFGGITARPRRDTILKLEKVLGKREYPETAAAAELREPAAAYRYRNLRAEEEEHWPRRKYDRQGEYTVEDYYALPEDQRVELIDGIFYDMGAPTSPHQIIGGIIYAQLLTFRNRHGGPCIPMMSPVDVRLDRDEKTMVQPDVLIICDRSKLTYEGVVGAPDLVAEVLSPSTRKKDMTLKLSKYIAAGVREYWIIDPRTRQVVVYEFEKESMPAIYTFADRIPVGIWNGECSIDLKDTGELLEELFPEKYRAQQGRGEKR